jgi:hypothetical protein
MLKGKRRIKLLQRLQQLMLAKSEVRGLARLTKCAGLDLKVPEGGEQSGSGHCIYNSSQPAKCKNSRAMPTASSTFMNDACLEENNRSTCWGHDRATCQSALQQARRTVGNTWQG